jgi:hypothetical protein
VIFFENQYFFLSRTNPLPSSKPPPDPVLHAPCQSTRISQPPDWYGFSFFALQATLDNTYVPRSYSQASTQECWRQAMHEELQALKDNHTWDIIPCPTGVKLIGYKWVYTIKLRVDGSIKRLKASMVVGVLA